MSLVAAFGIALLVAVLTSGLTERSPLSTTLIFLAVGLVGGPVGLDVLHVDGAFVERAADIALFAVLFTDGQHAPLGMLRRISKADRASFVGGPSRALLIGMPLTFAIVTVLAHLLAGLGWLDSLVLGAILAPTDPVFASALVGRDEVPPDLRQLLNIESGLNDGLCLPAVLLFAGAAGAVVPGHSTSAPSVLGQLALGAALGVGLPLLIAALVRLPGLGVEPRLQTLGPVALAVLLYAVCSVTHANDYIAAFTAGSVLATLSPEASRSFGRVGELGSELVKDAALLAFAALLTPSVLSSVGVGGWVLAVLTLAVARPLPVLFALIGSPLPSGERLAAAWFGPKGFASVVYALILLGGTYAAAGPIFALTAATVLISVVAHGSSDYPVALALANATNTARDPERR